MHDRTSGTGAMSPVLRIPLWSDDRTIDYRPRNGWTKKRE